MVQVSRSTLSFEPRRRRKSPLASWQDPWWWAWIVSATGCLTLLYLMFWKQQPDTQDPLSSHYRSLQSKSDTSPYHAQPYEQQPWNVPSTQRRVAQETPKEQETKDKPPIASSSCDLWLAESAVKDDGESFGLFAGKPFQPGELLNDPTENVLIQVLDDNENEVNPWHKKLIRSFLVEPSLQSENRFLNSVYLPGVGALLEQCDETGQFANIRATVQHLTTAGVHRSSPTAGSFSYHHGSAYEVIRPIEPGDEFLLACAGADAQQQQQAAAQGHPLAGMMNQKPPRKPARSLEWMQQEGLCVDNSHNLRVAPSTLPGAGRGAFAKKALAQGERIASTPMMHLDRAQLDIRKQETAAESDFPFQTGRPIVFGDESVGTQLLLNYAYGHGNSNLLMVPMGPAVNYINHSHQKPNAQLQWGNPKFGGWEYSKQPWSVLLNHPVEPRLFWDVVATRPIAEGEEILIDYGADWEDAWNRHVAEWDAETNGSDDYISALDYKQQLLASNLQVVRTLAEQEGDPYPENLETVCYVSLAQQYQTEWRPENAACLRPCDIQERFHEGEQTFYTAKLYPHYNVLMPAQCGNVPEEGYVMAKIPQFAVDVVDKPYTSDVHLKSAFRHEIRVPANMYPELWMKDDPNDPGQALAEPLEPGEMKHVRWADTGEQVCPNMYRLGLHEKFRKTILDYANKMNVTKILHHATVEGNYVPKREGRVYQLDNNEWYLQRPGGSWKSDIHWLSPNDEGSTDSWLELLSEAGFDEILKEFGEKLGMDGLTAFHGSFMCNSVSTNNYLHYDIRNSDAKQYNIIVPLILPTETGPELGIRQSDGTSEGKGNREGRARYEYDVGMVLGDYGIHATHPVDYRMNKEFRLSATIYVADFNEHNVDGIMGEFTQDKYPPKSRELLLSWAGSHWQKNDPSVKLPEPSKDHILFRDNASEAATVA